MEVSTRDKSLMEKVPVENAEQYVKDLVEKMKKECNLVKINGKIKWIPMIPFGLLGGFCDHLEIRITGLSEEGFSFQKNWKNRKKRRALRFVFFDFSADCYRKVQLAEKEREMKLTEETPFFFIYSVWTKTGEYRSR